METRYCAMPIIGFQMERTLQLHFNEYLMYSKKKAATIIQVCNKDEAPKGEGYSVSSNEYDPNISLPSGLV
jgi:hypothetical protein